MTNQEFFEHLDARIARYDLLCHPFYKAWTAGELTNEDLCQYAQDYYHHVDAFPTYLAELGIRLDEGDLRRAVLANMSDEKGTEDAFGDAARSHAELWLDFAEGMGSRRNLTGHKPLNQVHELTSFFHRVASEGTPEEALAAFYAYESQVPRVAKEKARGLQEMYGADERTTSYFTLHTTADVFHSQVWRQQLGKRVQAHPEQAEKALAAAENAAKALWNALDGIEARRTAAPSAA
jgi:pyrroloquinoline-quinone synthase